MMRKCNLIFLCCLLWHTGLVEGQQDEAEESDELNIGDLPAFITSNTTVTKVIGEDFEVVCQLNQASQNVDIIVFHTDFDKANYQVLAIGKKPIMKGQFTVEELEDQDGLRIQLNNISSSDMGLYTCQLAVQGSEEPVVVYKLFIVSQCAKLLIPTWLFLASVIIAFYI